MNNLLFPSISVCKNKIKKFPAMEDYGFYSELKKASKNEEKLKAKLCEISEKFVKRLGDWGAYRNQPDRERNENFLNDVSKFQMFLYSLSKLIDLTSRYKNLLKFQEHELATSYLEDIYDKLRDHLFKNKKPARIVTLSKAILLLTGIGPAFDSIVLSKINNSNPDLLAVPGVWPFCLYDEIMYYIAEQQDIWEYKNKMKMTDLVKNIQNRCSLTLGQIINIILWK